MRQTTVITGLAALLPSAAQAWSIPTWLDSRQNTPPYQDVVCKPQTSNGPLPPCVQIENIEAACQPNGTDSIHLEAHAQCMCRGSFFAEKLGCERCLYVHGIRSEADLAYYSGVLSSASNALCTGTPTAAFATVYSNIEVAATRATSGLATSRSDQAPSNTAISLYYTASGPQGPGSITGAAASATATAEQTRTATAAVTTTASTTGGSGSTSTRASTTTTGPTGTASDDAATTTTESGNGAMPTYAAGGLMMGAAGLALLAGL
ncbi:hypothetical protein CCHL11_05435 [Colletotrichum chlorophyti]|uniref:Collagen-like protein mcl1 n=1 Tax=Colletotrichum chlorophyti TaxID=708187 RepID=A0A1Q8RNQ9_9PEZI|nr:hypothetical protein CCHL11_05435 [Colletotrichum chlorophyti]